MRILAGDIGGTKTLLAIAEIEGRRVHIVQEKRFGSRDYGDFTSLARDFVSTLDGPPTHACFGVAGPVVEGRVQLTKLPWVMDESALTEELGLIRVRLINDFVAVAYGTEALGVEDLETLNEAEPRPNGNVAVIGAGTGLGEAIVVQTSERRVIVPSEGGHADFAARNDLEIEFLLWMKTKYRRVSYDRVVSGPGIADIFRFHRDSGRFEESAELRKAMENVDDLAPVIQRFADEKAEPLCQATLELFVSIYGAEAGNLALKAVATGGVYVAGGIAPRLIHWLKKGTFQGSFTTKGRLSPLLESMPVYAVMNPKVGLLGAALAAIAP